ncbi:MAG: TatD family hydrolase [Clostridia bacterium]|nr:TatD family hydrolase [Clostridia bacterium]
MIYTNDLKLDSPIIFDSHSHYDDERFNDMGDELFRELKSTVCGIVTCGCDEMSSRAALSLAEKHDFVYAAVGIHPESIGSGTTTEQIENLAKHKKCVAIGEVGLDYYWLSETKERQIEVFESMIMLAKRLDLPVIVHDRDAHGDTLEILKRHKPKGVVHCFSGSVEMAEEIIKLGMYIGVGGVITFKNAKKLPDVVRIIPDELLLVETDCPYLAPEPYRGKLCHSGMIKLTAQKIAEIRESTTEEILKLTAKNAKKLFNII